MIPLFADVEIRTRRRSRRFWLPLFLVWLLLLPLVLILLPFAAIACLLVRINPIRAFGAMVAVLAATSGTQVEVERPGTRVFVTIV